METWYKVDTSGFTAAATADWSGCGVDTYALLDGDHSTGGAAWTDDSKIAYSSSPSRLTIKLDAVRNFDVWLKATTVGQKSFSKQLAVTVKEACGSAVVTASSTPVMTNTVKVGTTEYQVFEKTATTIGARGSTATASLSTDVTFTSSLAADCPLKTWTIKSSPTATTNLASGNV